MKHRAAHLDSSEVWKLTGKGYYCQIPDVWVFWLSKVSQTFHQRVNIGHFKRLFAASINHKILALGQFLESHCIVTGFKLKIGSVFSPLKINSAIIVPGLVLVTPLTLAHPSASHSLDCYLPPPPSTPLVLLWPVQQLFCQHQVLRITSWSVVATVVHPLGAPALLPPLWSAVGSHAATHESETRARPVLPPPSETLPGSTHYHHHLPHPQHYFDSQGRIWPDLYGLGLTEIQGQEPMLWHLTGFLLQATHQLADEDDHTGTICDLKIFQSTLRVPSSNKYWMMMISNFK